MPRLCLLLLPCLITLRAWGADTSAALDFKAEPHNYFQRTSKDRFAQLLERLNRKDTKLDVSGDKPLLQSLLTALKVPVHSQMLVFSATSLQDDKIHPTNPRALYFNDDTYVGFVPGARLEVISIDPEIGAVFYIFDKLRPGSLPLIQRSDKCMNCHAGNATHRVPGLVAESVMPAANGASLESYRHEEFGHQIPLEHRFGGWHLTGGHHLENPHANQFGQMNAGKLTTRRIMPGELYDMGAHLLPTSDILPQLVHEHQLGFTNRAIELQYVVRSMLHQTKGRPSTKDNAVLEDLIHQFTRYILFADEAALPAQGIEGDPEFIREFTRAGQSTGASLRDFDLKKHLFKNRCSYMLESSVWEGLPAFVKQRVYARIWAALTEQGKEFAYLGSAEKQNIRLILKDTRRDLPSFWK